MPNETSPISQTPLVSVAMATYNAGEYLQDQIASILSQSYPHIEIVISDDESNDGTYERLLEYAASDIRIRVLPRSGRRGFNENFMHCFRACRGQWILPCDQDDIWDTDKIRLLLNSVKPGELAFCDSSFIDQQGTPCTHNGDRLMSENFMPCANPPLLGLLFRSCISGHAFMFPTDILENMPAIPPMSYYDHWISLWARANRYPIRYVDSPLVRYRRHQEAVIVKDRSNKAGGKIRTLQSHWAAASSLINALDQSPEKHQLEQLQHAMKDWFTSWISIHAFLFFFVNRNQIFRREKSVKKIRKSIQYFFGYKLRSRLSPRKYPPITECNGSELRFEKTTP